MVGFSGILDTGWVEDQKMMEKIASKFRGKLVKMVIDAGSKYDDYSNSPKIRQMLLHWRYELTEKDFFNDLTN